MVFPQEFPFSGTRKWFFLRNFRFLEQENGFSSGIFISGVKKAGIPKESLKDRKICGRYRV